MRRTNLIAIVIAVVALLAAGFAMYVIYGYSQTAAAGRSLGQQVAEVCAKGGPAAVELGQACAKAAEVKDQPPPVALPAPTIDPEVLRAAARTAVIDYCSTRNGCRGTDGRTPDFDAIVTAVVARIPAPQNGTNGTNGQPGQSATAEQVATAVAAYCGQASEPCRGPAGTKGDTGDTGPTGAAGPPGPTCPPGYELHDAVISDADGTTYQGKACVDPNTRKPPPSTNPPIPIPGGS